MSLKNRVNTMIILVNRMDAIAAKKDDIISELKNIRSISKGKAIKNRELYKLLYSSRSIDTFLKTFLDHHAIRGESYSIGKYIDILHTHTLTNIDKLTAREKNQFKKSVANVRNKYLHNSNTYPRGAQETSSLLSEIDALMIVIDKLNK